MDSLAASTTTPPFHLTRHGGIRLITRTRLSEDALLRLLNERQRVTIDRGSARKARMYLIYSLPDSEFFVVAVNHRTRAVITVLPLRLYECRIPGNPRIVPLKDLLYARNLVTLAEQRATEPAPSGAIVRLKMVFRRREGNVSREWREAFAIELNEDSTPIEAIETEKALLMYPGFLEKMGEVLSGCADSWRHVYRMYAEIQDLKLPSTLRREIDMPWTGINIEQAGDPEACERFPALRGLAVDDEEDSFDRYACPVEDDLDDELSSAMLPGAEPPETGAASASYA